MDKSAIDTPSREIDLRNIPVHLRTADWLCVFDPHIRYAPPGQSGTWQEPGPHIDPFEQYCIDSDGPPERLHTGRRAAPREAPKSAWDAFACNAFDRQDLEEETPPWFRGPRASQLTAGTITQCA